MMFSFFEATARGVNWMYLGLGVAIFIALAMLWRPNRQKSCSLAGRRALWAFIFALAFAPSGIPVHSSLVTLQAVIMFVFSLPLNNVFIFGMSLVSLVVTWTLAFGICAFCGWPKPPSAN
jgi:hypothetical protein